MSEPWFTIGYVVMAVVTGMAIWWRLGRGCDKNDPMFDLFVLFLLAMSFAWPAGLPALIISETLWHRNTKQVVEYRQSIDPVFDNEVHDGDIWIQTCGFPWMTADATPEHLVHECDHVWDIRYAGGVSYYHSEENHRCACGAEIPAVPVMFDVGGA